MLIIFMYMQYNPKRAKQDWLFISLFPLVKVKMTENAFLKLPRILMTLGSFCREINSKNDGIVYYLNGFLRALQAVKGRFLAFL